MSKKTFEKVAGAPAAFLDKTINQSKRFTGSFSNRNPLARANEFWKALGPGLTTGAADDDPSGVATYSQQGASTGVQLLWLALFTFPLMAIVQEMCARIGLVTGRGLAANIRRHYPRWTLYTVTFCLLAANTLNLGADLGAMAQAVKLLLPKLDFGFLVLAFAIITLTLQIFTTYEKYAKYLKWLALILLSYIFSALSIKNLDWHTIAFHALIPSITFSKEQLFLITGILGTTISPYLFFWQTSQEIEEEILKGKTTIVSRTGTTSEDIKRMRTDVWGGMFLSNIVMFFIIVSCAATLFQHGLKNINTAADAALALRPLVGENAYLLFAVGIIGAGLLAVPVLAGSASYALSESFRWKLGLYRKLKEANAFYGVIIFSTLIGLLINFIGIDPIKILIISAVFNGLIAPVVLFFIVQISSNKKIMNEWTSNPVIAGAGLLVIIVMSITAIATIASLFF